MEDWTHGIQREMQPPERVRRRIVSRLRQTGVIRGSSGRWWSVAAAILMFAAGWSANAAYSPAPAPRFIFFLYGGAPAAGEEQARVAEYREWAEAQRSAGRHVMGGRLTSAPSGFFVVTADTIETARAIAGAHPHARHGGTIEVRPVDVH